MHEQKVFLTHFFLLTHSAILTYFVLGLWVFKKYSGLYKSSHYQRKFISAVDYNPQPPINSYAEILPPW